MQFTLDQENDGLALRCEGRLLLRHDAQAPCVFVGQGRERMDMYRGNFDIEDYVEERTALRHLAIAQDAQGALLAFARRRLMANSPIL